MKNVLFIVPFLPYPLESGGHQAIFNGMRCVRDSVTPVVTYLEWYQDMHTKEKEGLIKAFEGNIHVEPFVYGQNSQQPVRHKPLWYRALRKLWHRVSNAITKQEVLPISTKPLHDYWMEELLPQSPEYVQHVLSLIEKYDIDIVQCEMLCCASFIIALPSHVKTIFVHHEIGFVRHQLELQNGNACPIDWSYMEYVKMMEIAMLNRFDYLITLSAIDTTKLLDAGVKQPIITSFAIVNTSLKMSVDANSDFLTFVGADSHTPNKIGVLWFLENCWNEVLQSNPNFRLRIIGKWQDDNKSLVLSKFQNVDFMGFVDDLAAAIQGTTMIVPIMIGSGIRMKILEAASIGVPFVSTSVGAEGIPVIDGIHCSIANDSQSFVSAVLKLRNGDLREKYITNAHALVKANYSIEALKKNRQYLYQ